MIFETAQHRLIIRIKKQSETISLALSIDLPSTHDISFGSVEKIRLLLHIISESVPFKPNISKLSQQFRVENNIVDN